MINLVLQQLEMLQSDLLAIDPARDLAAADRVADMTTRLREALRDAAASGGPLSHRLTQLRHLDTAADRAA